MQLSNVHKLKSFASHNISLFYVYSLSLISIVLSLSILVFFFSFNFQVVRDFNNPEFFRQIFPMLYDVCTQSFATKTMSTTISSATEIGNV